VDEVQANSKQIFPVGLPADIFFTGVTTRRFHNAEDQANPANVDFDTEPFEERYKWLGSQARE